LAIGTCCSRSPTWESKTARDAIDTHRDTTVRAILEEAAQHCEIVTIGEFEESEWVLEPR
jgi:hypothetical protein